MNIVANTVFLHGKMKFEKDLGYTVPDALGQYFVKQGWASSAPADMKCHTVSDWLLGSGPSDRSGDTLEIQDIHLTISEKK